MVSLKKRDPMVPWYIGLALVVAGVGVVAWQMYATECCAPPMAIFLVLVAIPVVYLTLMYLTLRSQP